MQACLRFKVLKDEASWSGEGRRLHLTVLEVTKLDLAKGVHDMLAVAMLQKLKESLLQLLALLVMFCWSCQHCQPAKTLLDY